MEKLKPCPFCGGGAYIHRTDFLNAESVYGVRCCDCESSSSQLYDTEMEAIEAWNTRYEPPTPGGIFVPAGNDRFKKVMSKNTGGKI